MSRDIIVTENNSRGAGMATQNGDIDTAANLQMRLARLTLEAQPVRAEEASRTAERLLSGQEFASYRLLLGDFQRQHELEAAERSQRRS